MGRRATRPPPPPRVATADFAALAEVRNPILSPNGHLIAAQETANGKTTLIVLNADQPESPAHAIDVGKADVAALRWAGNQRLLLTVWSSGDFFGFQLPFLRLLRIDAQTGASIVLDRKSRGMFAGNVLYSDPGGVWALVASQDDLEFLPIGQTGGSFDW